MIGKKGFSLIELMLVLTILGIVTTFAVPNFLAAKVSSRESAATKTIRNLITANVTFSLTKGYGNYASDLDTLEAVQLIDSALATGTKGGYLYRWRRRNRSIHLQCWSQAGRLWEYGRSQFFWRRDQRDPFHYRGPQRELLRSASVGLSSSHRVDLKSASTSSSLHA